MARPGKRRLLILAAAALVVGIGSAVVWQANRDQPPRDELTLYGNIDLRQVQLAFDQSARIGNILVQAGNRVEKGELLATLDDRRFQANLSAAQAELDARQAALDRLLAGSRPEEIERLRGVISADQADLTVARRTYERTARLARQDMASRQSADQARAARDAAQGRLQADQQSLDLAIAGPRQEDIAEARAAVAAAKSQRHLAQIAVDDIKLQAPSAGVIRNRILEPGDMTSPAQPVFSLALTNPLWARVYVDGEELGHVRPGLPATIVSDSFPNQPVKGWIGYISPTAEFTPKSVETTRVRTELVYQVRVYACNPKGRLRLGMPVTVHVPLNAKPVDRGSDPCQ
jgi:HlyD family secretion protein